MATNTQLEKFLSSNFKLGVITSTKAARDGKKYFVELLPDGSNRFLWEEEIGNKYLSPGILVSIPTLDESDYKKCIGDGMSEEEFFDLAFDLEHEEIADEMRQQALQK